MEFQELIKLLIRKKFYLVLIPLVSAMLAFVLRFMTDRIYISESQLSTGLTIAIDYVGDQSKINPFQTSLSFSNLIENMKSKRVVSRLSYKLLLHDLSSEKPFRRPAFEKEEVLKPEGEMLDSVMSELRKAIGDFSFVSKTDDIGRYIYDLLEIYEYVEKDMLQNVDIHRVGNTDFINIRFSSEVPYLSAYVANLWAEDFVAYNDYQKTNRLNESLAVLDQILKDKQQLLNQNTEKLNRYKTRYNFLTSNSDSDPIAEFEKLIREKESNVRSINFRLENLREKIAKMDKTSNFENHKKIVGLKSELDRLSSKLMQQPNNQQLMDSLVLLRRELQSEMYLHTSTSGGKRELDNLFVEENELELQYQIALGDLKRLKDQFQVEKGTVQSLASTKSGLENLETEVVQARNEFIAAQDKYNQARSELLVGTSSVKISYYGDVPEDPQSRKTVIFTALGLIVGFVMTLFVLLALELLDMRFKNPIKFRRQTNLDPSGTVVRLKLLKMNLSNVLVGAFEKEKEEYITNLTHTLRKVRYEILGQPVKVIMFTSLRQGAGKSFLLTAMAYSMSLIRKRVLIIDTNFRNNFLSTQLSKDGQIQEGELDGVIELNKHGWLQKSDTEMLGMVNSSLVSRTSNGFVYIVKSQSLQRSPEEVFAELDFKRLINLLSPEYDYIFIEGAALNQYSDSHELTRYVDMVVPIFSVDDEFTKKDKTSLDFILQHEGKVGPVILNKVDPEDA
ncbi:hypothetical protein N6H18_00410 [Reichenbachiella agarivorans]|uniref:Chromosome partitioning ATPase, Mrp family, contains Fe-S cluster n=1 Tax=Reichenbachiella agarivorans TaxID=2979464 RepID=A0ABY6CPJ2_9BACT|nr:hypothetical protein [Reichenbachiella agarivorans]UXP32437.1 hypothetical protein N6H18_00410 [Reichenbachiella agarivorans]